MVATSRQTIEEVRRILDLGFWPTFGDEEVSGVNLDDSFIPYCSSHLALETIEGFKSYLLRCEPLLLQTDSAQPYWMVSFPKQIRDSSTNELVDCAPEQLRMATLIGTYSEAHDQNMRDYDTDGFKPIIENSNPTAIGVGIFTLDADGNPKCVATSDVKTGAYGSYEYESGGEGLRIPRKYIIEDFVDTNLETEFSGSHLVYKFQDENELQEFIVSRKLAADGVQFMHEQEDGDFLLDADQIIVNEGQLPVHTLLVGDPFKVTNSPQFEIGQLANSKEFNGVVASIIAGGLLQIYKDLTNRNHDIKVGFSISPHFLEQIKMISNPALVDLISARLDKKAFKNLNGRNVKDIIIERISSLKESIKLYPLEHCRYMVLMMRDGSRILVHGVMQGDTVEIPAYIQTPETN